MNATAKILTGLGNSGAYSSSLHFVNLSNCCFDYANNQNVRVCKILAIFIAYAQKLKELRLRTQIGPRRIRVNRIPAKESERGYVSIVPDNEHQREAEEIFRVET